MTGRTIEELALGDTAQLTRVISGGTVRDLVEATGDDNPLHSDPRFAATTPFGQVIAPGLLTGGLLSAVMGTQLPGPGTVYLSQSFRFLKPVHIGDTLTARVEVVEILSHRNRLRLRTMCLNQYGETVLDGEAWVMPSRVHVEYPALASRRAAGAPIPGLPASGPAALALQVMTFWMTGGLVLAQRTLELCAPWAGADARVDPVRP